MSSNADADRESLRFSEDVPPGETQVLTYEAPADLTIERMEVRIYRGAEFALEIEPFVDVRRGEDRSRREDIVVYRGSEYIAGDADKFRFDVSKSVKEGQTIGVEVRNRADEYSYHYVVDMSLERAGGLSRLIGGIL